MEALEQLALTGQVTWRAVRSVFVRPLAWPALVAFAGPALAAIALVNFAHPLLSPLMLPVARALGGDAALHYPGILTLLPSLLERLGRLTNGFALTLLLGWAATVTAYCPHGVSAAAALLTTLQRSLRLLFLGAPFIMLHTVATLMSAAAVADLPVRLISAVAHLMAAFALEAAVLGFGMLVLPVLVREDLRWSGLGEAFRRAIHWSTVAALGFGIGFAAIALVGRVVFHRAFHWVLTRHPDAALFVVLAAALVTAIGIVVFAAASVALAAALDEGWE